MQYIYGHLLTQTLLFLGLLIIGAGIFLLLEEIENRRQDLPKVRKVMSEIIQTLKNRCNDSRLDNKTEAMVAKVISDTLKTENVKGGPSELSLCDNF